MLIGNIGLSAEFTESQVRATTLFAEGVLRLGTPEDGKAVIINSITGKKFVSGGEKPFAEILADASRFGVSEFKSILGVTEDEIITGALPSESGYQRLSDITRSLNEGVFGSATDFSREAKAFAGIEDVSGRLTIERFSFMKPRAMGSPPTADSETIHPLQEALERIFTNMSAEGKFAGGEAGFFGSDAVTGSRIGLLNIQQDAAVLMRFRIGEGDAAKYLTSEQISRLLSFTGSDILGEQKMGKLLGSGVANFADDAEEDILTRIGTAMSKQQKEKSPYF